MNNNYNGYNNYNNYNNNYNQMPTNNVPNNNQNPGMPTNAPSNMDGNFYDFSSDLNNNNGYSNANATYSSGKSHHFHFFGFLEFLIIIFLCVYIANDKGYLNIKFLDNLIPEKEVKEETTEEVTEAKEVDLSDTKTISELTTRTYYLNYIGTDFNNLISPIYNKTTKISDVTDKQKLGSILLGKFAIESGYTSLTDVTEFNTVFPSLASNPDAMNNIKYIDATNISNKYLQLYGSKLAVSSTDSICPEYVYNSSYNRYYINYNCQASEFINSTLEYVYKTTSKEDKYYVYVSVAFVKENTDGSYIVYKDYNLTKSYKELATEADYDTFDVDVSNYQEFSKYKITFTKNNNNYVFEQIEPVTE